MNCEKCSSENLIKNGFNNENKRRYKCKDCGKITVDKNSSRQNKKEKPETFNNILYECVNHINGIKNNLIVYEILLHGSEIFPKENNNFKTIIPQLFDSFESYEIKSLGFYKETVEYNIQYFINEFRDYFDITQCKDLLINFNAMIGDGIFEDELIQSETHDSLLLIGKEKKNNKNITKSLIEQYIQAVAFRNFVKDLNSWLGKFNNEIISITGCEIEV